MAGSRLIICNKSPLFGQEIEDVAHYLTFSIWIASKTRWAHLTKTIQMEAVPRVGEFVKFTLQGEDDYVPWRISEITYRETGSIEIWTELLDDVDGRGYSFEDEDDFDEALSEYQDSGWDCPRGVKANTRVKRQKTLAVQQGVAPKPAARSESDFSGSLPPST